MKIRSLTLDDLAEMERLVDVWVDHWEVPDNTTFPRFKEWMTGSTMNLATDTRSYWEDDRLLAFGLVSMPPSEARQLAALIAAVVDPARRGEGTGTDLVTWQLIRARDRLLDSGSDLPMFIRAWAWRWFDDTRTLLEQHGLAAVRQFDVMEKRLNGRAEIVDPNGLTIVPWDRTRDDETRAVNNTAFADHWGAVPISAANWAHLLDSDQTRIELSRQAMDGDRVAGYTLSAEFPMRGDDDRREAWVRILGVHPEWRKQGVGTSLMRATEKAFAEGGFTHSVLRVDADSPTGANRLYAGLGYRTVHSSLTYELPVSHDM